MGHATLLIFPTEDREMDVTFRMLPDVNHERISTPHSGIELIVKSWVAHQQSQRALIAVDFGRYCLDISHGLIHFSHGRGHVYL